jgi:AAA15 family ATPase/GTPase
VLLEFGLKNFFCFKEGVSISFKLGANCPPQISQGRNFTTVLCVKGANGSGKTQILKGLSFLANFCYNSFSREPDSLISISPFFDSNQPCEFYIEFSINDIIFYYELIITDKEVLRETIYKTKSKKTKIIERINNEITNKTKALSHLHALKLRKNASIISTAHQYELDGLNEIYDFFKKILSNVNYGGLRETPIDISTISKILKDDEETFDFVKSFIKSCDVGISDIKILSSDDPEGNPRFFPIFWHEVGGEEKPVTVYTESSGTKALYRDLASYRLTLKRGGVLVLDEFDVHLHPHILPKLIDLFLSPEANKNNGQLIFSTHNSEILDHLGRYRTYLVNKVENESFAYRLDEIPGDILRNDRSIIPAYNNGNIGGIPNL